MFVGDKKMTTVENFHSRIRWQRLRSRRLREDGYICQECKRYGRTTKATTVHHIYPIETHWELRYNINNLISLCNKCHELMHNRQTRDVTDAGREWQSRVKGELERESPLP